MESISRWFYFYLLKSIREELITQLSNKSFTESEVILACALNFEPKLHAKTKHHKDDSVRLEVTFTKLQWEKLEKMRELVASSLPHGIGNWDQVLEYVASDLIRKRDKSQVLANRKASVRALSKKALDLDLSSNTVTPGDSDLSNNTEALAKPTRKPVPITIQRKIHQRDQCCQYQDKISGKQCKSTWRLQVDHIQPVWAGGRNAEENLRILCRAHNLELYRQQANISQS